MRRWKKCNVLNQLVYENIYPTGSATAKIYDITKMYKYTPSNLFPKFWYIVSSMDTNNHNLPKYLCEHLSAHLPMDPCTEDSFIFVEEIKSASFK